MKTSFTVARIPDNDWENLLETVTLDGSYSDEIKDEIWTAIENIEYYSNPWVVVRISEDKSNARIFCDKDYAQQYYQKAKIKLKQNERVFCIQGQYK